jgi:hypothetical protein
MFGGKSALSEVEVWSLLRVEVTHCLCHGIVTPPPPKKKNNTNRRKKKKKLEMQKYTGQISDKQHSSHTQTFAVP